MRPLPYRLGLSLLPLFACSYAGGIDTEGLSTDSGSSGTTGSANPTTSDVTGYATTSLTADPTDASAGPESSGGTTTPVDPTGEPTSDSGTTMTPVPDTTTDVGGTTSTTEAGTQGDTSVQTDATGGTTIDVPPVCENGALDGDETDVDCGGPTCAPCGEGLTCAENQDCASLNCVAEMCVAPTCEDGIANGSESDVDCGGFDCAACNDGLSCNAAGDCMSLVCENEICSPPACDDAQKNGGETDVDCGGPDCGPCGEGLACVVPDDCASGACEADLCVASSCSDGAQNGGETGVDCGGPTCAPCQLQTLVINEIDYDQAGDDLAEFIEIYNNTGAAVPLQGLRVLLVNGNDNKVYRTIDLSPGGTLDQGGYLVIANPNFVVPPGVVKIDTPVVASGFIQNGSPDGVALVDTVANTLLDALSYEGAIVAAILPFGTVSLVEGAALQAAVLDSAGGSLSRLPNGNDKNDAATDWALAPAPTPGAANVP